MSLRCVLEQDTLISAKVQPRKTRPFITERLFMGHKVSNQTKDLRMLSRGNTRKPFKCDRGIIFQVTNFKGNPLQTRSD